MKEIDDRNQMVDEVGRMANIMDNILSRDHELVELELAFHSLDSMEPKMGNMGSLCLDFSSYRMSYYCPHFQTFLREAPP